MVTQVPVFLARNDISQPTPYVIQANGGNLIIGFKDNFGGVSGDPAKAIQKGFSQVKHQLGDRKVIVAKATALGTLLLNVPYNSTKSKLVFPLEIKMEGSIQAIHQEVVSKASLILPYHAESTGSILHQETAYIQSEMVKPELKVIPVIDYTLSDNIAQIRQELKVKTEQEIKKEKIAKLLQIKKILTEDIRKTPSIDVNINEPIHQRGDLMRITANMSLQSGKIYMRIIDDKGIIVQKAGLVKTNATGFQILTGTRDLKAGKYFIQVSNHDNFSPLGVAEFQIKGDSPILPFIPIIPFLLTPDSPTGKFTNFIFRTMQDSRVDAVCKKVENKIFKFGDKDAPIPPLHFNCRCWVEGLEDE